ncbi:MAG TPA: peptide ligase PGM1-related protein [Thermoanaerobaculia bacterium]|nr:peptide ligase PGM1-related protein [Thermoanaerobaculia bacterium]
MVPLIIGKAFARESSCDVQHIVICELSSSAEQKLCFDERAMTVCPTLSVLELEQFELLKPRLAVLWDTVFPGDEESYTSVIVPSLTLDQTEMAKIAGMPFYEERLLFLLMRLRNPQARVVYVTSQPIHPMVLDYYLQLLIGIPASHARARLTLLCAYDSSPRPLTEKILERPRLLARIRASIIDPERAYLTVFNSTPLEVRLCVRLGIPINAPDPRLAIWGTKSGSRRLFRETGVEQPAGFEDLHSLEEVVGALLSLHTRRPSIRCALLKLNEGFSGEGNAVFTYPDAPDPAAIRDAMSRLQFSVAVETAASYLEKFEHGGGIVEELIEAKEVRSPSVQIRINPRREVLLASTHEQIMGGSTGQLFLGCLFPAADDYRCEMQRLGIRVAEALAEKGVIGRFSVDFLATRNSPETSWRLTAIEVNLRMGGTTHPMLALRFLTGGQLDRATGLLFAPDGGTKYYRASDNVQSERYRGLLPEDLIEIITANRLGFNHRTGTGVLFHMIGAVSQFGKFGMIAIGDNRDEADRLFATTIDVLDRESGRTQ